ncbi:unnamed protein product, partial [Vitis vinifera]
MGVKVATTCLQWSQPIVSHSPSSSQTLASAISSPPSKRRNRCDGGALVCRYVHRLDRSAFFGIPSTKLCSSRSFESPKPRAHKIKRACSAGLDSLSDEEFSKRIEELALRFQVSDEDENPPDWPGRDEIVPANIERKANSVDLPLSLRIIKRKKQWQEGFREAGESAYCSVKKAFSSMVFIIRELHSFTLQMREGILDRVQQEMHASFVWLFQQVFSHTPTLMVYVMILLANFTVYSIANNTAIAASPPPSPHAATIDGTDGDGRFDRSEFHQTILPDGVSQISIGTTRESESVSGEVTREEEVAHWNSIVDEASKMQAALRDESLDHETMQRFVSPVEAKIEADDYADYFRAELLYQMGLAREPNNPLLLANYAQFLYLVAHDYDRAEEYFKRAIAVEPPDAEAYNKYASFLWVAKKDLWAAEETYLEAIAADPSNTYYAANYAHFLWSTGGDDTCFPLSPSDDTQDA